MFCSHCGKEVLSNSNFCNYCGKNLKTTGKNSAISLPNNYILLICLSLGVIFSVVLIPYLFFELNGHEYTMKSFMENDWPHQVDLARDLEIICDIFLLATSICAIAVVFFASKRRAKPCLISSILICIFSALGFSVLFEMLSPIENSGGTPIGFMVNLIVSVIMIVISAKRWRQEAPKKIKSPLM